MTPGALESVNNHQKASDASVTLCSSSCSSSSIAATITTVNVLDVHVLPAIEAKNGGPSCFS